MSADNGIYILSTPTKSGGREYRVKHLQNIEDLDWDEATEHFLHNDKVRIGNARKMWNKSVVFTKESAALKVASRVLRTTIVCEYGISYIEIEEPF